MLLTMLRKFASVLPPGQFIDDEYWNLISWSLRPGNGMRKTLDFAKFRNTELCLIIKLIILHKRCTKQCGWGTANHLYLTAILMDKVLPLKQIRAITNEDFNNIEQYAEQHFAKGTSRRLCDSMAAISTWLNSYFALRVSYKRSKNPPPEHGREGTEEGRKRRRIHIDVLRQLIGKNAGPGIHRRDKFFINMLTYTCPTGFRVNELTTLPEQCEEESAGEYSIRYYPEKSGKLSLRVIPTAAVPNVKAAIEYLRSKTELGRRIARNLIQQSTLDWHTIAQELRALEYFVRKWCAEWLANPIHSIVRKDEVWINKSKRWINLRVELAANGGNKSKLARNLKMSRAAIYKLLELQEDSSEGVKRATKRHCRKRQSWDTDARVISVSKFFRTTRLLMSGQSLKIVNAVIEEAKKAQIAGTRFRPPRYNDQLESEYTKRIRAVVYSKNNERLLEPKDALLITEKYAFSDFRSANVSDYTLITDKEFTRWLSGEKRSTDPMSQGVSCFVRLDIRDPDTRQIANFTPHDVRRWLDTIYENGGLTQDEIALIFGRTPQNNAVYDQTSIDVRMERLRDRIRKHEVFGIAVENYSRLADESREEAEHYLKAHTLMAANMPHGFCTLNWGMQPCPHQLSCFANSSTVDNEPCEDLIVDYGNDQQMDEIKRINSEAKTMTTVIPNDSPQKRHFKRIAIVTETILDRSCGRIESGRTRGGNNNAAQKAKT